MPPRPSREAFAEMINLYAPQNERSDEFPYDLTPGGTDGSTQTFYAVTAATDRTHENYLAIVELRNEPDEDINAGSRRPREISQSEDDREANISGLAAEFVTAFINANIYETPKTVAAADALLTLLRKAIIKFQMTYRRWPTTYQDEKAIHQLIQRTRS